jgi:O-antigen/teichoic acid export membrane protein
MYGNESTTVSHRRIMGFFYRIFLSQTIGSRGIGLYQLVVPLQHMVLAVTTAGIQTALSRTVASQTALKRKKEAVDSFCVGTLFALGLSLAATTKTAPEVVDAMLPYFSSCLKNEFYIFSFCFFRLSSIN